jgi:predicted HicB family RNase H-like nuclease
MSTVTYKGYMARIDPDLDDGILVGRVVNTRDIIGFHGETIAEAMECFHAAVDEYLEDCQRLGKDPNKPYSGKFSLRLSPKLHSDIAIAAGVDSHDKRPAQSRFKLPTTKARRRAEPLKTALDFQ